MKQFRTWAAVALTLTALSAAGQAAAQTADCDNAMDQATLNQCAAQDFKTADARLNQVYRALTRQLELDSKKLLLISQRAWIAYKEATCAFEGAPSQGGSIYSMIMSTCLTRMTQDQTALLERHLDCNEGHLNCVRD